MTTKSSISDTGMNVAMNEDISFLADILCRYIITGAKSKDILYWWKPVFDPEIFEIRRAQGVKVRFSVADLSDGCIGLDPSIRSLGEMEEAG